MNYQALLLVCLLPFTNQQKSQGTPTSEFTCPEDFGYFPHPTDCTQYYVCVFGGALLESCTGGLMYSHELQTCDWPRNVYCFNNTAVVDNNLENTQQSGRGSRSSAAAATQRPGTAYAYTPIKIETIGQLRNAEEVGGKKLTRVEDEYTQQRSGRSYEGSLPNYKEEIYQNQGRSVSSSPLTSNTRSKYAGGTNKYYDNGAPAPQQEEYANDDVYANQRYAANVGNNSNYYYAPAGEEDDSSYYVYDDEEEDSASQAPAPANKYTGADFDYKYQQQPQQPQQPYTRAPVTRRPVPTTQPTPTRAPSTRTRTRGGGSSSSSSSSSTRSRPTLKPKSQFKTQSAPVRDVYLDAPSRPENIYETPNPNTPATKCRKDLCVLPDCSCGGKEIPGGLTLQQTPQIVLLTFDDSVNDLNKNLYRDLFEKGRKNPNGCPISATFYISHEWTDYSQVQNLAADGHEIASHSVSHSFGEQYSQKKWDREINGQREILAAYGGVKLSEVRGMRAPFLAIGGNNMFKMLHDSNFTYDSSMPIYENRPPSWPYTLDYRIFHDCMIPPCPTKSYPGVWEVPMVMWQDLKGGRCSMGDACSNPPTAEGVYQMLAKNFERHYTTNRAPFGLYYHAAWFTQAHHKEGFEAFLDTLVQMDDVWLVTNYQALQWIRNPTPNNRILNFEPWSCHDLKDRPPRCNHPKVCNLWHKSGVRYMKTCQSCPQQYPWTGNTGVPYSNSI
ncbi:unnamed protein product [Orchesella dallaii]|uniref:Chitin-binding type-2 domain-containing protein n=1 Tax=Orchesella dallaii TaxID=48710 RepID=A0ABP1R0T3_9HEXA